MNGQEILADIERAGPRTSELTRHLLASAGRARVKRRQLNVSDLVADVPGMLGAHVPPAVSLSVSLPQASPTIDGVETPLRQVLSTS